MRRILLLCLLLGTMASVRAGAQSFFSRAWEENQYTGAVGVQGGVIGIGKPIQLGGFGINFTFWGFYLDFLVNGAEHSSSQTSDSYEDNQGAAIHVGYQLPINDWFRVIPLIGYCEVNQGITDGSSYSYNEQGSRQNSYSATARSGSFNFGASAVFHPFDHINFYLTGTLYSVYAGIGYEF